MKKLLWVLIPFFCVLFLCGCEESNVVKEAHVLKTTGAGDVVIDAGDNIAKPKMKFDIFKTGEEIPVARIIITQTTPTYSTGTIVNRMDDSNSKPQISAISIGMLCRETTGETLKAEKKVYKDQRKRKKFSDWEGKNVNDLIAAWGAPTQVIDNGTEGKIMVWRKERYFDMGMYSGYTTFKKAKCYTFWVNPQNIIYRSSYAKQ